MLARLMPAGMSGRSACACRSAHLLYISVELHALLLLAHLAMVMRCVLSTTLQHCCQPLQCSNATSQSVLLLCCLDSRWWVQQELHNAGAADQGGQLARCVLCLLLQWLLSWWHGCYTALLVF